MTDILLRVLATAALLTAPFVVLAVLSGKAEGALWLMLPFILLVPILFAALVVFLPAERLSAALGLSANVTIPVLGGVLGALVAFAAFGRAREIVLAKFVSGDLATIGAVIGIVTAGVLIGLAWRMSAWALAKWGWN